MPDLTSTDTNEYRMKAKIGRMYKILTTFLILPTVLCSVTLGGIYICEDAISPDNKSIPVIKISDGNKADGQDDLFGEKTVAKAEDIRRYDEEQTDIYTVDYDEIPEGEIPIIPISLSSPTENGVMKFRNASKYELDYLNYIDVESPVKYENSNEYQVLILHTHSTEAYTPEGIISDDPENPYLTRSDDKKYNMIGIGDIFESTFNCAGIKTLHCEVAIDKASYSKAYDNAAKLIQAYLKEYPSIKYVFDIHRDAVNLSSGEKAKVVCSVKGKTAAQIMFVVGTDTLGQNHPRWEDNLALAIELQLRLEEKYTDLTRPINVKQGAFNQHYAPLGLLIEIGCDGNYLSEAQYSAQILAEEIVDLIKSK